MVKGTNTVAQQDVAEPRHWGLGRLHPGAGSRLHPVLPRRAPGVGQAQASCQDPQCQPDAPQSGVARRVPVGSPGCRAGWGPRGRASPQSCARLQSGPWPPQSWMVRVTWAPEHMQGLGRGSHTGSGGRRTQVQAVTVWAQVGHFASLGLTSSAKLGTLLCGHEETVPSTQWPLYK